MFDVAALGPKHTFSHEAALKMFTDPNLVFKTNFADIFEAVRDGAADYGILPLENSTTGSVNDAYLPLVDQEMERWAPTGRVKIVRELVLPVNHNLLAPAHTELYEIRRVVTHEQPRRQCVDFIRTHLPDAEVELATSTAEAAQRVSQLEGSACIAGDLVMQTSGLKVIRPGIQDSYRNMTRFVAVSSEHEATPGGTRKSSVALVLPDRPGALGRVLILLADQDINVVSVKTLPVNDARFMAGNFKDWFVLDLETDESSEQYQAFLRADGLQRDLLISYKFLGSYPTHRPGADEAGSHDTHPEPGPADPDIEALIAAGESATIEFKSTLRVDLRTGGVNTDLRNAVAKTIAAFLNSDGGTLLLGVGDDGATVGIEPDVDALSKKNTDSFLLALFQTVINSVGEEYCQFVRPRIASREGKQICVVAVDPGTLPAWSREGKDELFYIRTGNSSRQLTGRKAAEYISRRFMPTAR